MNMTEAEKANAALSGGVEIEVLLKDGTREKVLVREIAIEEYPALLKALNDEQRQVEIFCGRPEGWAARLRPRSHHLAMVTGEELNKEPFFGWCARRIETQRILAPGKVEAIVEEAFKKAMSEASRTGSRKSL